MVEGYAGTAVKHLVHGHLDKATEHKNDADAVTAAKELANNQTKTGATRTWAKLFSSLESGSGGGIISDDASTEQELDKRTNSRIGARMSAR